MGMDYIVIQPVRQLFGDEPGSAAAERPMRIDADALYAGVSKDFPFSCPNAAACKAEVLCHA
jgi:hypothetical protein